MESTTEDGTLQESTGCLKCYTSLIIDAHGKVQYISVVHQKDIIFFDFYMYCSVRYINNTTFYTIWLLRQEEERIYSSTSN